MALNDNAIMTLAEAKTFLGIGEDEDVDDSQYEIHINAVSSFLVRYLNREIIAPDASVDEIFDGTGVDNYTIRNNHFNNIDVDVPVLYYRSGDSTWEEMTTSSYPREFDSDRGIVYLLDNSFNEGSRNYKINHKYGYAIASVPYDIKIAGAELVQRYIKRIEKTGVKYSMVRGTSTGYDLHEVMNVAIMNILAPYKRFTVG